MNKATGRRWVMLAVLLGVTGAMAGPYTWVTDPSNDASGGAPYEIYGIGYRFEDGKIDIAIRTNFPEADVWGAVTGGAEWLSPGDLYINVNGSYAAGTGTAYGLGMTTHLDGDKTATDHSDDALPWKYVYKGGLYKDAVFATGTYEGYPNADLGTGTPWDGDGSNSNNNYPTLIADYYDGIGYQGDPVWNAVGGEDWEYVITASIDRTTLGLWEGDSFEVWWSYECGNDAAMAAGIAPAVPEPASLALLLIGCGTILRRRRLA